MAKQKKSLTLEQAAKKEPFPHGISCEDCTEACRCNHCGKPPQKWWGYQPGRGWNLRCTNGRCPDCCYKRCDHRTAQSI